MGVVAQHRGNAVIARQVRAEALGRDVGEEMVRVSQIALDCNAFVTNAMDYLIEPRGLREMTVERAKNRRGWDGRHAALMAAHSLWVDSDHRAGAAHAQACILRAQAAHALLSFALGGWTIPEHIQIPRAAEQSASYYRR